MLTLDRYIPIFFKLSFKSFLSHRIEDPRRDRNCGNTTIGVQENMKRDFQGLPFSIIYVTYYYFPLPNLRRNLLEPLTLFTYIFLEVCLFPLNASKMIAKGQKK